MIVLIIIALVTFFRRSKAHDDRRMDGSEKNNLQAVTEILLSMVLLVALLKITLRMRTAPKMTGRRGQMCCRM